jgi:hypothetical protein
MAISKTRQSSTIVRSVDYVENLRSLVCSEKFHVCGLVEAKQDEAQDHQHADPGPIPFDVHRYKHHGVAHTGTKTSDPPKQ